MSNKKHIQPKIMASESQIYWKYRAFSASECPNRVIEIIRERKLYAADFKTLNDPMEGIYWGCDNQPENYTQEVLQRKTTLRVCSFTQSALPICPLMWAHYARECSGVALGFSLSQHEAVKAKPVNYKWDIHRGDVSDNAESTAEKVLRTKLIAWANEREARVLTESTHVQIEPIRAVIFGHRMKPFDAMALLAFVNEQENVPILGITSSFDKYLQGYDSVPLSKDTIPKSWNEYKIITDLVKKHVGKNKAFFEMQRKRGKWEVAEYYRKINETLPKNNHDKSLEHMSAEVFHMLEVELNKR